MPKTIKFKQLHLISYTGHDEITVNFKDITKLSGQNGEGKSSIGEAPAWIFWGCDLAGGKFNPSPTDRPFERVFGSLLLSVDGTDVLIAREIINGSNKFYINEVPQKATEFDAFISSIFSKEQFLSLYSPGFFFTQHWSKQREQVMQHVTPPSNKEVFQAMSRTSPDQKAKDIALNPQAARLEEELKKHTIADLEKKQTDIKGKSDKLHTQSQGSVKTLKAQLDSLGPVVAINKEALQQEGDVLDKKIQSYEDDLRKVRMRVDARSRIENKIEWLNQTIKDGKEEFDKLSAQKIDSTCNECKQELTDEAKATAKGNRRTVIQIVVDRYNANLKNRTALRTELESLPLLDSPEPIAELITRIGVINSQLQADIVRTKATADLEQAKQNEVDYLKAKNDAIFVLDAIKSFKANEATLQVSKVQALFTTLSVRLFDYVKSSDSYNPTFVIQMDGKDYEKLSVGEKIAAGLELSDVLYKQSELVVPVFVDNIESFTSRPMVYGQLITGRAVPDQKLKIESEEI